MGQQKLRYQKFCVFSVPIQVWKADVKRNMLILVPLKILGRASDYSWDLFDAQQEEMADVFEYDF